MKGFIRHFQSLEKGKLYLVTEHYGAGLEVFLLMLTALMDEDQSVRWVDYIYRREPIESYYERLNIMDASKVEQNKNFIALDAYMMLDFYAKRDKETIFLDQEPFYVPYCFDHLIEKFQEKPTKFIVINNLNSFTGHNQLFDNEERNWIIKQFKRVAVECNAVLLLAYSYEDFSLEFELSPPKLDKFNWSRNMVKEVEDIYFFIRYDYFIAKYEKDLAKIFSLKKKGRWSEEIKEFSPVDLLKHVI
jgi:hypothetical protein